MPQDLRELVEQFYNTAAKYRGDWPEIEKLPPTELDIVQKVIMSAGYEIQGLRFGRIHRFDAAIGNYYNVNDFCPYIVIGKDGDDNHATDFLDLLIQVVMLGDSKYNKKAVVDGIVVEIRSRATRSQKRNLRG